MTIEHVEEGNGGRFYVETDGETGAEMTYTKPQPDIMQINHTEVATALRHENMGSKLVAEAVAFARANHQKIKPVCPFVKAVFAKKEEYADVLAA